MAEAQVETTATEPQTVSNPVPATPSSPTLDLNAPEVKAAIEREAQRRAQSLKDKEIARVHQQHQQEVAALKQAAKGRLQQAGDENPESFDDQVEVWRDAAYGRAARQKEEATVAQREYAAQMARDVADAYEVELDPYDQEWMKESNSWEEVKGRMRTKAKTLQRQAREAETARERQRQTDAADARAASGELDALGGAPAAPANRAAQAEQLYAQLDRLLTMGAPKAQREAVKAKLRELGETV